MWIDIKTNLTAEKDRSGKSAFSTPQSTIIRVFMVKEKRCQNETSRRIHVWFNKFAQTFLRF